MATRTGAAGGVPGVVIVSTLAGLFLGILMLAACVTDRDDARLNAVILAIEELAGIDRMLVVEAVADGVSFNDLLAHDEGGGGNRRLA